MILRAHRQDILTAGVEKLNLNLFAGVSIFGGILSIRLEKSMFISQRTDHENCVLGVHVAR